MDEEILKDEVEKSYFSTMAFDWIHKHLYWTGIDKIFMAPISNLTIVRSFSTDAQPTSIALNPINGVTYWSIPNGILPNLPVAPNGIAAIWSAWMDGSHKTIIANNTNKMPMSWPLSLTIDFIEGKLYWVDTHVATIERVNLDGTGREIMLKIPSGGDELSGPTLRPFAMAYHKEYIYWTDIASTKIKRLHISNRSVVYE